MNNGLIHSHLNAFPSNVSNNIEIRLFYFRSPDMIAFNRVFSFSVFVLREEQQKNNKCTARYPFSMEIRIILSEYAINKNVFYSIRQKPSSYQHGFIITYNERTTTVSFPHTYYYTDRHIYMLSMSVSFIKFMYSDFYCTKCILYSSHSLDRVELITFNDSIFSSTVVFSPFHSRGIFSFFLSFCVCSFTSMSLLRFYRLSLLKSFRLHILIFMRRKTRQATERREEARN